MFQRCQEQPIDFPGLRFSAGPTGALAAVPARHGCWAREDVGNKRYIITTDITLGFQNKPILKNCK